MLMLLLVLLFPYSDGKRERTITLAHKNTTFHFIKNVSYCHNAVFYHCIVKKCLKYFHNKICIYLSILYLLMFSYFNILELKIDYKINEMALYF